MTKVTQVVRSELIYLKASVNLFVACTIAKTYINLTIWYGKLELYRINHFIWMDCQKSKYSNYKDGKKEKELKWLTEASSKDSLSLSEDYNVHTGKTTGIQEKYQPSKLPQPNNPLQVFTVALHWYTKDDSARELHKEQDLPWGFLLTSDRWNGLCPILALQAGLCKWSLQCFPLGWGGGSAPVCVDQASS